MTLPDALDVQHTTELGGVARPEPAPAPAAPVGARQRVKRLIRGAAKRALVRVAPELLDQRRALATELAQLRDRVDYLGGVGVGQATVLGRIDVNRINLELLKGEVRALESTLNELGMSFAPATGLAGAGARFSELREQVNALERRLRQAENARPATSSAPGRAQPDSAASSSSSSGGGYASELFNYVAFERRFRGDPVEVVREQAERYADLLAEHTPVIDIGCGRAELLELLASRGVECEGVDTDAGMVAEASARGLTVHHTDALSFLSEAEPGSLGSVFSAHVAEHLELDALITFIELALSRLKPGGIFVAETPNPQSLIVLGNSYILDPTHVRPLHPSLFSFLCETAGFRDVRLHFYAPATGYHLEYVDDPTAPQWVKTLNENFRRLNEVLYGPQEYAVIATSPPAALEQ